MRLKIMPVLLLVCCATFAAEPALLIKNLEAGKKQHLITYGTSLTAGGAWVGQLTASLGKKYPGLITVTNSAKGGMWSKWGLDNLDEKVIAKNPDTVIIEWAINDAFLQYKTTPDMAQKNLEEMIDRILKHNPKAEIILMTMNPPINVHLEKRPDIEKYYEMYRTVAKKRNLRLVDHYPAWKAILDKDKAEFLDLVPDGIHPNAKGCEKVITPAVEAALMGK